MIEKELTILRTESEVEAAAFMIAQENLLLKKLSLLEAKIETDIDREMWKMVFEGAVRAKADWGSKKALCELMLPIIRNAGGTS